MNGRLTPWSKDADEVLKYYSTNRDDGLNVDQVRQHQEKFGKNILKEEKKRSVFLLILKQFNNPMAFTLGGACLIAMILGEVLNTVAILLILILNGVISFIQESKAYSALEALKKMSVPKSKVYRDGALFDISSEEIVPGDIIYIEAGDFVSADARIFESIKLSSDEAHITGESFPVTKQSDPLEHQTPVADRNNMLHAGTAVSKGAGKAIVTSTGMNTEIGKIAGLLDQTKIEKTPLELRLEGVTKKLLILGLIVIVLVAVMRYLEGAETFVILMSAISLAVAAIPEGLPTIVTIALTIAVRRMTKRHAIVRSMGAVETLGSTDVICTDKTGTLTTGIMTVRHIFMFDEEKRDEFFKAIILCNTASIDHGGAGDPTEKALLKYAQSESYTIEKVRSDNPKYQEWSFDSDRKRMSVAVKTHQGNQILVKGAPEAMLSICILDSAQISELEKQIQIRTSLGERILAVAHKMAGKETNQDQAEDHLDFLGLVSMADAPKPDTVAAIKECQKAGIKVVMISGDHPVTARAIATEIGIIVAGSFDQVMTGKELEVIDDEVFSTQVEHIAVYARVSPLHKLKIIEAFQKNNHIVAMTGDGVNDAPALKKAQIGIAMGKGGTEVARQASSMILTDDHFATIVSAIEEGRAVYINIKRTILYLLSTNLAEILIVLGASFLRLPVPLNPIGLLWINLITDGMPSLALAIGPVDKNILTESSRPSPTSFFDKLFIVQILMMGLFMTLICLGVYSYMINNFGDLKAKSVTFALLVFMCLFTSFACRSETKSFFTLKLNYYHLSSVIAPIVLHYYLQKTELFQKLFEVGLLSDQEFLLVLFVSMIPFLGAEMLKLYKK